MTAQTELQPAEVHIWLHPLTAGIAEDASGQAWLEATEQAQAARLRDDCARATYLSTRSRLRMLLAGYLGQHPADLRFVLNAYGKPRLAGTAEHEGLVFNLSHTRRFAVLAFALDTALGVDIEMMRPRRNLEGLARFCLAADELAEWLTVPEGQHLADFTRRWTAKEAFAKAVGRGLAAGVRAIVPDLTEGSYRAVPMDYGPAHDWQLQQWRHQDCQAALAYRGVRRRVRLFGVEN
jgi:4'-phosphopantetheinyl transferase